MDLKLHTLKSTNNLSGSRTNKYIPNSIKYTINGLCNKYYYEVVEDKTILNITYKWDFYIIIKTIFSAPSSSLRLNYEVPKRYFSLPHVCLEFTYIQMAIY